MDRAANKRRFLVVKRSGEMLDGEDQELEQTAGADGEPDEGAGITKAKKKPPMDEAAQDAEKNAAGAATEKARARAADEEADSEAEKAKEPPPDGSEKKKERKTKALSLPAPLKDALLSGLTDALERLMALANSVKDAEATDDGEADVPDAMSEEMDAISEMLSALCEGAPAAKRKAASVTKAGARMSRDRLDRFQKALSLLADILKELTDLKIQPGEPTAGAAQKALKKQDAAVAPATVPGMAELVTGISELTTVVKRQEEELGRIRQTRGVSNAIQVDGGGRRAEAADVSWPLDMNRPISREQVKKEVSFFDE